MDIRLPRLGEGADSGTVASIFVKEGDRVKKDQLILELESEKAVASIPASESGTVLNIHVREGETIKVGQLILTLAAGGVAEATPRAVKTVVGDGSSEQPERAQVDPGAGPELRSAAAGVYPPTAPEPLPAGAGVYPSNAPCGPPPAASPTIRKMARELGIDLRRVRGSERGGRIVMDDMRRYVAWLQETAYKPGTAMPAVQSPGPAQSPTIDFSRWGSVQVQKMTTLRRTISTRMVESWTRVPHVTQFDEADVTRILALRKMYAVAYEQQGAKLTLTSFALRAVTQALKLHPLMNASLNEAAGEVVFKQYFHIGLAVDTEHGLIVPVIRDAETKSMKQLSIEVQQLAGKARQRKLALEEMQGGTFSISNQGGIGGGAFTPIINAPEAAILGMGRSVARPVIREGRVVERIILPLGLSYDHRLIDGANAARFMVDLVRAFEQFDEENVKI
jgi:pyruvate dehydrogenase E2 component (dihydrolipoamide acetyltransferase)